MRTLLIRVIALAIIIWAGFQPGAALNPDPQFSAEPSASDGPTDRLFPVTSSPAPANQTTIPQINPGPLIPDNEVGMESELRFAVIGDYGSAGRDGKAVAEMVIGWNVDLIITTGDNNYAIGSAITIDRNIGQYYHDFIFPYKGEYGEGASRNRFFPALGNHDWLTEGAKPYIDYFTLPGNERYYDFVWGPVHFFALDSDIYEPDGITQEGKQAKWLQEELAASESEWHIVYMHHPPYSSSNNHGSFPDLQWPFQEWGADAVLAGHDHVYERLVLNGLPYFVNGLGGMSRYRFGPPLVGSELRFRDSFGAMLVEANSQKITFEFHALEGDTTVLIDRFMLSH